MIEETIALLSSEVPTFGDRRVRGDLSVLTDRVKVFDKWHPCQHFSDHPTW
jgi:hypothetical protein